MNKKLIINGQIVVYKILSQSADEVEVEANGESFSFKKSGSHIYSDEGHELVKAYHNPRTLESFYQVADQTFVIERASSRRAHGQETAGRYMSPMPGKILKVYVKNGDTVKKNDPLLVMEAMKMEHTIKAIEGGRVVKICFEQGEQVGAKVELIEVES